MQEKKELIRHVAPTLAAALDGPFCTVATQFIKTHFNTDTPTSEETISEMLNDPKNLMILKGIDSQFKTEMKKLNIDVLTIEVTDRNQIKNQSVANHTPQIIISAIFLISYFLMLAAIFVIEASDSINMEKGNNSLLGELQILFGVLTAGVGQILSFWFGGLINRKNSKDS